MTAAFKSMRRVVPTLFLVLAAAVAVGLFAGDRSGVRAPAVAGSFYPADPAQLAKTVDTLLARPGPQLDAQSVVAIIAPHAGYEFSGSVAATGYSALKGRKVRRVVVIAPSHYESFGYSSVYDGEIYATPLGEAPVDREFGRRLAAQSSLIKLAKNGHISSGDRGEHALEVELPFLQRTLGSFQLVPVVMGEQDYQASRALGTALARLITGPDTLIVASSDLSHFHPYDQAVQLDRATLGAIEQGDYLTLSHNLESRTWEACGGGPIVAAMIAAERLGATQVKVLKYANSGDITGDRGRVVGYGAVAFLRSPQKAQKPGGQRIAFSRDEQQQLLKLARQSVETAVREGKLLDPPATSDVSLAAARGAFVTLTKKSQLRGCIGYTVPIKPLYLTVRDVAAFAALRDSRFPPVRDSELSDLEYEISVLTPFRRMQGMNELRIGEHGLLVRRGEQIGVLLPQVATEQHWDKRTFLEQACLKAGLPENAWRDQETDVFLFSATIFGDHDRP
ncbi:MAG: AmmeMemoRadiSam system protein B [Chlamydiota bacterium]